MQISLGAVNITQGSNEIVFSDDDPLSSLAQMQVGGLFVVTGDLVPYYIGSVNTPANSASGFWEAALTAPYMGMTNVASAYRIVTDFTPNFGFPRLRRGDAESALIYSFAVDKIDAMFGAAGVSMNFSPARLVGATIYVDCNELLVIHNRTHTLTGNLTIAFTNLKAGMNGSLRLKQDGTGGRTITLPAGSKVVDSGGGIITLSSTPNSVDILSWIYDGENTYWFYGKNFS